MESLEQCPVKIWNIVGSAFVEQRLLYGEFEKDVIVVSEVLLQGFFVLQGLLLYGTFDERSFVISNVWGEFYIVERPIVAARRASVSQLYIASIP